VVATSHKELKLPAMTASGRTGVASISSPGFSTASFGSDTPGPIYDPLEGRAPVDACETDSRPLALDEPAAYAGGRSFLERYKEIVALMAVDQPKPALWSNGDETAVTLFPGEPFDVCDNQNSITFKANQRFVSADGRVDVISEANGAAIYFDGALERCLLQGEPPDQIDSRAAFVSNGISGIDFLYASGATWHTELLVEPSVDPPISGAVTVQAVDIDGQFTGTPFSRLGVLERLSW
jgi:hypothetical protein